MGRTERTQCWTQVERNMAKQRCSVVVSDETESSCSVQQPGPVMIEDFIHISAGWLASDESQAFMALMDINIENNLPVRGEQRGPELHSFISSWMELNSLSITQISETN